MTNEDGLYNSIYILIGVAHNWSLNDFADLYGVTPGQFELWLLEMGFDTLQIKHIQQREPFRTGNCRYCGILTDKRFCSQKCSEKNVSRTNLLNMYIDTKVVPSTVFRNIYYNITTGEIEKHVKN